uniref:Large ribosomal subunit protein uL3m n=1 Tax=Strigamia maritima TaxID=126957 RepID=T1IMK2_STRMM
MAASGFYLRNVLLTTFTSISATLVNQTVRQCPRFLAGFIQTRDSHYKRRKTHASSWWVKRKLEYAEQDLTTENFDFLQDQIKEEFAPSPIGDQNSPLREPPWARGKWEPGCYRTGVIARKIGIYPMWTKTGQRLLTTVLQVLDNHVIRYIPPEVHALDQFGKKYNGKLGCAIIGAEAADPQLFTDSYNGLFKNSGVQTKRKLTKFIVSPNAAIQPGTPLTVNHFRVGDYVDVWGKTVGHGFQGVMKRWGFKGGPATHGCTKSHRRPGCIGAGRTGRVWRGKKMPGHMGQERRILHGLKIWRINTKYNVIYVHGPAVPGHNHAYVYIMDSRLKEKQPVEPPFPTHYLDDIKEPLQEEYYDDELHPFGAPTVTFPEDEQDAKTAVKIKKR